MICKYMYKFDNIYIYITFKYITVLILPKVHLRPMSLSPSSKVIFNLDLLNYILSFTRRPDKSYSSPTSALITQGLLSPNRLFNPLVFISPSDDECPHVIFWKTRNKMPMGPYIFYKKHQRSKHISF